VFFKASRSFADLFKLPRLHFSPRPFASWAIFGWNEVDFTQFETVLVLQRDTSGSPPSLASNDYKALIRPEPYLEGVFCPMWRRTDFFETKLAKKCERFANSVGEFLQCWWHHNLLNPF
jgi:hypothetical protein